MEFPHYMVYFVWYLFWFLGAATAIFCFCFVFSRSFDRVECRRSPGRRFVLLLSWMHVFFLFERTGFFLLLCRSKTYHLPKKKSALVLAREPRRSSAIIGCLTRLKRGRPEGFCLLQQTERTYYLPHQLITIAEMSLHFRFHA